MKNFSITSRLTITTALLSLLVFVPAGVALYSVLSLGIRADAIRSTEDAVKDLAFSAVHQWDEGLLDRGGENQLKAIGLNTPHWALVRGGGRVVSARGAFAKLPELVRLGDSVLHTGEGQPYRVASIPLFNTPTETFEGLPDEVRELVRRESPEGVFLRAKREVKRGGTTVIEVLMLERDHILELESTAEGDSIERDTKGLVKAVPPDLVAVITRHEPLDDLRLTSWKAYNGQLVAVVDGAVAGGERMKLALNRLGERFVLDDQGEIVRPETRSRLWVVTAEDATAELTATNRILLAVALGFALLWFLVTLVGWYITRRAMSPVKRIVAALERIEVSNLNERLPVGNSGDELDHISATINRTLERIESGYARERQFTGDASHELRSPLAKVIADIDVSLSKNRTAEDYRETLVRCRAYAAGMRSLVESLLWLARLDARREALDPKLFELTDLAAEVIKVFPAEQASRIRLDLSGEETVVTAFAAPGLVRVMLHNLLQNALRYSPDTHPVAMRLSTTNGVARVEVEDSGNGIPADQVENVFSRFFRVDKARSRETGGFGLGLAIVNEIARAHGTGVSLTNLPTGGLRASFSLPVRDESGQGEQPPATDGSIVNPP